MGCSFYEISSSCPFHNMGNLTLFGSNIYFTKIDTHILSVVNYNISNLSIFKYITSPDKSWGYTGFTSVAPQPQFILTPKLLSRMLLTLGTRAETIIQTNRLLGYQSTKQRQYCQMG